MNKAMKRVMSLILAMTFIVMPFASIPVSADTGSDATVSVSINDSTDIIKRIQLGTGSPDTLTGWNIVNNGGSVAPGDYTIQVTAESGNSIYILRKAVTLAAGVNAISFSQTDFNTITLDPQNTGTFKPVGAAISTGAMSGGWVSDDPNAVLNHIVLLKGPYTNVFTYMANPSGDRVKVRLNSAAYSNLTADATISLNFNYTSTIDLQGKTAFTGGSVEKIKITSVDGFGNSIAVATHNTGSGDSGAGKLSFIDKDNAVSASADLDVNSYITVPALNGDYQLRYDLNLPPLSVVSTTTSAITIQSSQTNNGSGAQGQVGAPIAAPTPAAEGIVSGNVTLTTATPDAAIYYTTDGTDPTSSSNLYSDTNRPFVEGAMAGRTTIKAIAIKGGMQDSTISTFVYNNLPTIEYIKEGVKGSDTLEMVVRHISYCNNDYSGITAAFQGSATTLTNPQVKDANATKDEATLVFNNLTPLPVGTYPVSVYNAAGKFNFEGENSYTVFPMLTIDNGNIPLSAYTGSTVSLKASANAGDYPWNAGDTVHVKIFSSNSTDPELEKDVVTQPDKSLVIDIPENKTASPGTRSIQIYKDNSNITLACGGFNVANMQIQGLAMVHQGTDSLYVYGSGFVGFAPHSISLKVYNGNDLVCSSSDFNQNGDSLNFNMNYNFNTTGVTYTAKLMQGTMELTQAGGISFMVAPELLVDKPIITGQAPDNTIKILQSSIPGYSWAAGSNINVSFYGIENATNNVHLNYNATGTEVAADSFSFSTANLSTSPLPNGNYCMDIFNVDTGKPLGYVKIKISATGVQISGNVWDGTNPVGSGWVNIFDNSAQKNYIKSVDINSDGSYMITDLAPGIYNIQAFPSDLVHMISGYFNADVKGTPITDAKLTMGFSQFNGTVTDPQGNIIKNDYGFNIQKAPSGDGVDMTNISSFMNSKGFAFSGFPAGDYYITAIPYSNLNYGDSNRVMISVDSNGVAKSTNISLKLTSVQFSATVTGPNGTALNSNRWVNIFDSKGENVVYTKGCDQNGIAKIGGLSDGTYYIQADAEQNPTYEASDKVQFSITNGTASSSTIALSLNNKVMHLAYAHNVNRGWDSYFVDIRNVSLSLVNGQYSGFTAQIFDEANKNVATLNSYYTENYQRQNDAISLRFNPPDGVQLGVGTYTIKVYHNGTEIPNDGKNSFNVLENIILSNSVVSAEDYAQGKQITVDIIHNNNNPYPWTTVDNLTIKSVLQTNGWPVEFSVPATINANGTLSFNLKKDLTSVQNGLRWIDVYRGDTPLATTDFAVGSITVTGIETACQNDNNVFLSGTNLFGLGDSDITASVFSGNNKIGDATGRYRWGDGFAFNFDKGFDSVGTYTLKLYRGGTQIASNDFAVAPRFDVSTPFINDTANASISVQNNSSISNWNANDALVLNVGGPQNNITTNGLTVGHNTFTVSFTDPLAHGYYRIKITDAAGTILGFADFGVFAQKDIFKGHVVDSENNTVTGGKVDVVDQNNSSRYTAKIDGQGNFVIVKDNINADENFKLVADPQAYSSDGKGESTILYSSVNSAFTTNNVTIQLQKPQIKGVVKFNGNPYTAGGGVVLHNSQNGEQVADTQINSDGSYKFTGIKPGDYNISALPYNEKLDYLPSNSVPISVNGSPATTGTDLDLQKPQLYINVFNPDGSPSSGWPDQKYQVAILDGNNNDLHPNQMYYNNSFRETGLTKGTYTVLARPQGNINAGNSNAVKITVDDSGNITPNTINLNLTTPAVTGNVLDPTGNQAFSDGNIEIFNEYLGDMIFLGWTTLNGDGSFRLGGLDNGTYYIRIRPNDSRQYSYSSLTRVDIGSQQNVTLRVRDKTPLVTSAEWTVSGGTYTNIHINNFSSISADLSKLSVKISGTNIEFKNAQPLSVDNNNDTAVIRVSTDNGVGVPPGQYNLEYIYNAKDLEYEMPIGNIMYVAQKASITPLIVSQTDYNNNGVSLTIIQDKADNVPAMFKWAKDTKLKIRVLTLDSEEYNTDITASGDDLTINLPKIPEAKAGQRWVSIYKGDINIAFVSFFIGQPQVKSVSSVMQGDNHVQVNGFNLRAFMYENAQAKIYDGDSLVATSNGVNYSSGSLKFYFDSNFDSLKTYTIKIFVDGTDVTNAANLTDQQFTIVPRFDISNMYLNGASAGETVELANNSGQPGWSAGDNIQLSIGGPNSFNVSGSLLSVQNNKLVYTRTAEEVASHPLPNGYYRINVMNSTGQLLGYADFRVFAQGDVLRGHVTDSSGKVYGHGWVEVKDVNGNNRAHENVDSYGNFYIESQNINGDGDYTAIVYPDNSTPDALGTSKFSIANGKFVNTAINVQLQKAQIEGTVSFDGKAYTMGGAVFIQDTTQEQKQVTYTYINSDGSYKLAGLKPGNYHIMACPYNKDLDSLPSDSPVITVGAGTVSKDLELKKPQLSIDVLNPDGSKASVSNPDDYQFRIRINNTDTKQDVFTNSMYNDNNYRLAGLTPGNYMMIAQPQGVNPNAQSYGTPVVVGSDGTITPNKITISLTAPKVDGKVQLPSGQGFGEAFVQLYKKHLNGYEYLTWFVVDGNGSFKIGGVEDGEYYLKAVSNNSAYGTSSMQRVVVGTDHSATLTLGDKSPKVISTGYIIKGQKNFSIQLNNISGISDLSKLSANIVVGPNDQTIAISNPVKKYSDSNMGIVEFDAQVPIDIPYGSYIVHYLYDGRELAYDQPDSNKLVVIQHVDTLPHLISLSDYRAKGTTLNITAFSDGTNTVQYPWSAGDQLTLVVHAAGGVSPEYEGVIPSTNGALTAHISAQATSSEGFRWYEIYKGDTVVAEGEFDVGTAAVQSAWNTTQYSNHLQVDGKYLMDIQGSDLVAKVYDSNNNLIATSNGSTYMDNYMDFSFSSKFDKIGTYTIKVLKANNEITPASGVSFKVVPQLSIAPTYIVVGSNAKSFTVKGGTWKQGDTLSVQVKNNDTNGPMINASYTIAVNGDLNVTMPDGVTAGQYYVAINRVVDQNTTELIGYTDIQVVSSVQLSGTVKDKNNTAMGSVTVMAQTTDYKNVYFTGSDFNGNYAFYNLLPGSYRILALPPFNTNLYRSSDINFDIKNDKTSTLGSPVDLVMPDGHFISGTVTLPDGAVAPSGGLSVYVYAINDKGTPDNVQDDFVSGYVVQIPEGQSSGVYSINVPAALNKYYIQLDADPNYGYVDNIYYKAGSAVYSRSQADLVDTTSGNISGKDITMVKGYSLSGMISLPSGKTAPAGGLKVNLTAFNSSSGYGAQVTIPEGSSSVNYHIQVPVGSYSLVAKADVQYPYETANFYQKTGTTTNKDAADVIAVSSNTSAINFSLLDKLEPTCSKAVVMDDGATVKLYFTKLVSLTNLPAFKVTIGGVDKQIQAEAVTDGGATISLTLKDTKILKDNTGIKISYSKDSNVVSVDGMALGSFDNLEATNKSVQALVVKGITSGMLINHEVVVDATYMDGSAVSSGSISVIDNNDEMKAAGKLTRTITAEGEHTVLISVPGILAPISYKVTIDKTAPVITIGNCDSVINSHTGVIPTITFAPDVVESSKNIMLNGRAYDGVTPIKEAGSYTLIASGKDKAGNITTATKKFDISWDMKVPSIGYTGAVNGGVYEQATPVITLGGDTNLANYTYTAKLTKPDGSIANYTKADTLPALTAEGKYRLEVFAVNPSYTDITSSSAIEFTVDKNPPTITIGNISGNLVNTPVTPIITFSDAVATQQLLKNNTVVVLKNGNTLVPYNLGDTISSDGSYTLTATTTDAMGHTASAVPVSFTIDTTKPVISLSGVLNGYTYKDKNVVLTAKTNEGSLTVTSNGDPVVLDGNGQYTFTGEDNKVDNYKLLIKATDAAGNVSEQMLAFSIDKLAVNMIVSGVSEGQLINYNPNISFDTYEGTTEKSGTTATIDGTDFAGGNFTAEGSHTMIVSYKRGDNTYTKTVHFTIDKTPPTITINSVAKNSVATVDNIVGKVGDSIKVSTTLNDTNGVGDAYFVIGTDKTPLVLNKDNGKYEGEYKLPSGNYNSLGLTVYASDAAGNQISKAYDKTVTIDNTKPTISAATNPAKPDGNNGIFKASNMSITLTTGASDKIRYSFNGASQAEATGSVTLTPVQGTNTLVCSGIDAAGNVSDDKAYIFEYDNVSPQKPVVNAVPSLLNTELIKIAGTLDGESGKLGTRVLLKKGSEIIAQGTVQADKSFVIDNVRLAEGSNSFTVCAIDRAGNIGESAVVTTTLDTTAPIVVVEKVDDTHYTVNVNEGIAPNSLTAKFNGVDLTSGITKVDNNNYTITTPTPAEGVNTLNVALLDIAGNTGLGSFTSTYMPPATAQSNLSVTDNATMDIPADAFPQSAVGDSMQMLVKTVTLSGDVQFKPLGSPISFEFKDSNNASVEPAQPLLIKNYIGTGLTGVVLMHIDANNNVDSTKTAIIVPTDVNDPVYKALTGTGNLSDLLEDTPYYLGDTGYLVFKTKKFSSYQVGQDNTAPVITVTTTDFDINAADKAAGKMAISGTYTDNDLTTAIKEVDVDGTPMSLSGMTQLGTMTKDQPVASYSIPLNLADGTHEVVVKVADSANNTSTITRTYNVDTTAPVITATAPVSLTNKGTVDISINVDKTSVISINNTSKGTYNGSALITVPLTEGTNTINVSATDTSGNTGSIAHPISITMDKTPPVITVNGVNNGDVYGTDVTIGVQVTGADGTPSIKLDGVDFTPGAVTTEGQHTLAVTAQDAAGNNAATTILFTIDKSVPTITLAGVDNNAVYNSDKTISITANNADELTLSAAVDGNAMTEVTGTGLSRTFDPGVTTGVEHTYRLQAVAKKTQGSTVSIANTTINFTIDMKKPELTLMNSYTTEETTANITGTVDEASDIYLNGTKMYSGTTGSFTLSNQSLVMNDNTFTVKVVDKAGNETVKTVVITRNAVQQSGGNGGSGNGGNGGAGNGGNSGNAVTSTTTPADQSGKAPEDTTKTDATKTPDHSQAQTTSPSAVTTPGDNTATADKAKDQTTDKPATKTDGTGKDTTADTTPAKDTTKDNTAVDTNPAQGNNVDKPVATEPNMVPVTAVNKPTIRNGVVTQKPEVKNGAAVAAVTTAQISTAAKQAVKDEQGVKVVKLEIPKTNGASSYTENLPVSAVKADKLTQKLEINTPAGTITVPSNMFTAKETENKKVIGVSVAKIDVKKLDPKLSSQIGSRPVIELKALADGKAIAWSNPSAPVKVSIGYKPTAEELKNPDSIVVWYIDGQGRAQAVPSGSYDAKTGKVTFMTTHFSKYAVAFVKKTFADITASAAKAKIEAMASKGIVSGADDKTFKPKAEVTRGDFIGYLVRALSLNASVGANFVDVKTADKNYMQIAIALKLGIVSKTMDNHFKPDEAITREDMAVFTVKAMKAAGRSLKSGTAKDLNSFIDAKKLSKASAASMASMVKEGLLQKTGNMLNPKGHLQRAEAAQIIYNLYKHN